MATLWDQFTKDLDKSGLGLLTAPIEQNASTVLHGLDPAELKSSFEPLYVEELLRSVVDRISACLSLKEKSSELEIRAMTRELDDDLQLSLTDIGLKFDKELYEFAGPMQDGDSYYRIADGKGTKAGFADDHWTNLVEAKQEAADRFRSYIATWRQKSESPGNPSNYVERFTFLQTLFEDNLLQAYRRALVAQEPLKTIYDIDDALPSPQSSTFFNEFVLWSQNVSDQLDEAMDRRVIGEIAFAFSAPAEAVGPFELQTKEAYKSQLVGNSISGTITSAPFEALGMRKPRLRTVRVAMITPDTAALKAWPVMIEIAGATRTLSVLATNQTQGIDRSLSDNGCHNMDPIGKWTVTLQNRSLTGDPTAADKLPNVILMMQVAYVRPPIQ